MNAPYCFEQKLLSYSLERYETFGVKMEDTQFGIVRYVTAT